MLTFEQGKTLFGILKQVFDEKCSELNELDSVVGDGDHGFTMQRGFDAVYRKINQSACADFAGLFDQAAIAFAEYSGGAIGPILSAFFAEGGILFKAKTSLSTDDLASFFKSGTEAVMQIGGAAAGDKTIVDAMIPVYGYFSKNKQLPLDQLLHETWQVAEQAAIGTRDMIAKQGRARFLKARSRNFQDAGATSFSWIVYAFWKAAVDELPRIANGSPESPADFRPHGKFVNLPADIVPQDNKGLTCAYPGLVKLTGNGVLVRAVPKENGKVGLAIGHGGGHTPSMGGFIGPGLLDADVYGPIFTCASGIKIFDAIRQADRGAGVVLLVSNHAGDVLNARVAERRARQAGIEVELVMLGDDIATAPRSELAERRGLGGLLFALKIGGAAAERGYPLNEVASLMRTTNERTASLSVALSAPTHPVTGKPLFEAKEDHIEIGVGVHGEAGIYSGELKVADEVVDMLMDQLLKDMAVFKERDYLAFLNGSGGTSRMELHILFQRVYDVLVESAITPAGSVVDSLFTTQEMKGFSLSFCAVTEEMASLWNDRASGPNFRWPAAC